ncbi:hypothetical protein NE237_003602 [Protea cynaroides]|uniref:Uncharacterized protein n=1 Tax=Protea cynaroides TaxID=273540 RepID=A0A9Q0KH11_9MAGN|nr:hypothetical protein NE237_003602 [Protea cynaroides]
MANAPAPSLSSNNRKMAMDAAQAEPTWIMRQPASSDEEAMKTVEAPMVKVEEAAGKDSNSTHSRGEEHVSVNQPQHEEPELAEGPGQARLRNRKHHSDKSIAGGGIILGGLAATFVVSVIRYLRVTRKRDEQKTLEIKSEGLEDTLMVVMVVGASFDPPQSHVLISESPLTQGGEQHDHCASKGCSADDTKDYSREVEMAEAPVRSRRLGSHHHRSINEVVGGGIILAGLLITVIFSVICYIRTTRSRPETKAYA